MRGKEVSRSMFDASIGITPAYAGKRTLKNASRSCMRDHPRLCGEKEPLVSIPVQPQGSPPPMRGKARSEKMLFMARGITPAYAGKRSESSSFSFASWDHPRLCGEKVFSAATPPSSPGSPPPMRGKVDSFRATIVFLGITPAYAGKSE